MVLCPKARESRSPPGLPTHPAPLAISCWQPSVRGLISDDGRLKAESVGKYVGRPGGDRLSHVLRRSIIGAGEFHGRVRDGIGCRLPAMATRSSNTRAKRWRHVRQVLVLHVCAVCTSERDACLASMHGAVSAKSRRIGFKPDIEPIGRLGPVSCMGYPTSTPGLSTWWSTTALRETSFRGGFPA